MNSWLIMKHSKVPAQSDREPVDNLSHRDKADSKAKSTKAAKAGDEVQPGHLWQPLIFWSNESDFDKKTIIIPYAVESPKKMSTMAMSSS